METVDSDKTILLERKWVIKSYEMRDIIGIVFFVPKVVSSK